MTSLQPIAINLRTDGVIEVRYAVLHGRPPEATVVGYGEAQVVADEGLKLIVKDLIAACTSYLHRVLAVPVTEEGSSDEERAKNHEEEEADL